MPKLKTHKGTAKRIKISGTGKLIRERAFGNHILAKKSKARKRNMKTAGAVEGKVDENGMEIKRGGEFIGFATSRVAEYFALKEGCEQAIELGYKTVRFVSDNLMMVNQMNGVYQIKNSDILQIYNDINNLILKFEAVAFVHVRREQNEAADAEANMAIDQHYAK